jgi:predicted Zn-dependent protease
METPRRSALLETALQWGPENPALLQIVLDPATASAASTLSPTTSTTSPVAGAAIRALVQAVDYSRKSQPEKARQALDQALTMGGPSMPTITAYAASVWAESKSADAGSALTLSTLLLEARPKEPAAQWAQGKALAQQGKWAQAVGYLETALAAMPQDPSIHASLATAYEKLGQPTRAAEHRRLAQPATVPTTTPSPATQTASK